MLKKLLSSVLLIWGTAFTFIYAQNSSGWNKMKLGAGGWMTGMSIHPSGSPVYARSDVHNAWKWDENSGEWSPLITSSSMPADRVDWHQYYGVMSIVSAPSNNQVAYMAYYNTVLKSTNQGDTWVSTNFPGANDFTNATMKPNTSEGKVHGERLAVDPANQNVVYLGSINDGLYVTSNGGNSWNTVAGIPSGTAERGIRQVVFDPYSGTTSGKTNIIYITVDGVGVYKSTNAGASWSNITGGSGFGSGEHFTDMEISSNSLLYVSSYLNGVGRYNGSSWTNVSPPGNLINELAVDPFDNNSPWLAWEGLGWISIGELVFDPAVPGRLWMSEGIGTWRTTDVQDGNISWNALSNGQEHMVNNDIIALQNGNVITALWDRPIFVKNQSNLNSYPTDYKPNVRFNSSWSLDYTPANPNFVAAIIEDHRYCCYDAEHRNSGYSMDGGQTWNKFGSMPEPSNQESIFGAIAVAANDINNIVWVPAFNKTPHYTTDRGNTWNPINMPGNSGNCCITGYYLSKQPIVADRVLPNTFYLYDWGNGNIFKSTDGGANWTAQGASVPAWSWHTQFHAVDGKAGHLLFAHGWRSDYPSLNAIHGLYISTNGGVSFNLMTNTDKVLNFTTGKAAPGASYPTIFIQGEVNGDFGYHMSSNMGVSWTKIGTYPLGNYNYAKIMSGDPNIYGRINDVEDGNCNCAGVCPAAGTACNDSNPATVNDIADGNCNCAGILPTSSGPAVCSISSSPTLDGFNGEWSSTIYPITNTLSGTVSSTSDLSATFQTNWDNNYLYVYASIQDANLFNDSAAPWNDDSFELYIDGGNEQGSIYDGNDHQLVFRYNDNDVHYPTEGLINPAGVDHQMVIGSNFYNIEIRISWSFIGISPPTNGDNIGIDVHVNDDDNGGNRDKKIAWHTLVDNSWSNPSLFKTLPLSTCHSCVSFLSFFFNPIATSVHHASNYVTANQVLLNSSNVSFYAGNFIELFPGFEVPLGSEFTADIVPCN